MNNKRSLLGIVLGLMLVCTPFTIQAETKSDFKKVILKNGITFMYRIMKEQPMVSMYAVFPVGSNNEPKKGIAHLLEHLVFRGGSGYSFNDILEVTNRKGGQFNGFTTFYDTIYNYVVPKANFEEAFQVFNGSLWKPNLVDSMVSLERKIVVHEADLDYSEQYRYYPVTHYFYPENNFTKELYNAISTQDLINFHRTYYQPGNTTYILAGNFDPQKVIQQLEQLNNGFGLQAVAKPEIIQFNLPQGDLVESRNIYPFQYQLFMAYEFKGLSPSEQMLLRLISGSYLKQDYERNQFQDYFAISRHVGVNDYFGIYYLEQKNPYSDQDLEVKKAVIRKHFREFRKMDFKKAQKNLIDAIEMEFAESAQTSEGAVRYEVQKLTDPDNIMVDAIPLIKKLTRKDLEKLIDTYFSKPPTTWILVKTNKTDLGGN